MPIPIEIGDPPSGSPISIGISQVYLDYTGRNDVNESR